MELVRAYLKGILKLLFKCDGALVNDSHLWLIDPVVIDPLCYEIFSPDLRLSVL